MNTHANKTQENKSHQSVANAVSQKQSSSESTFQLIDNRPKAAVQRKLQEAANNSSRVSQLRAIQETANNSTKAKQTAQFKTVNDDSPVQFMSWRRVTGMRGALMLRPPVQPPMLRPAAQPPIAIPEAQPAAHDHDEVALNQQRQERFRDYGHGAAGMRELLWWERMFLTAFEESPFAEGEEAGLHRGPND